MNFFESIKVAAHAIWANKMRSLLTMLGIIIGISSVITVVTLGQGSRAMIGEEFEQFGVNRVYLSTNWRENPTARDYMTYEDLEAIKRVFGDKILGLSSQFQDSAKILSRKDTINIYLTGVNETYNKIEKIDLIDGRFLQEGDVKGKREVAVIDEDTALQVFGRSNVLGEKILVKTGYRNISLVIIGIYRTPKSAFSNMSGYEQPKNAYLPVSTIEKMYGEGNRVYGVEMNIAQGEDVQEVSESIVKFIERRHGNEGEEKYRTYTAEGEMESVNKVTGIITLVISAIAAISLVVGGIGVMNIMLVSVTERTREIGIRMAIGACRKDILLQFLVEAIIISGIGGIIGTLLGVSFSFLASIFIKIPPTVSLNTIAVAWLFSAGVGIFFGIYPANKASKLDPIEALRYE
ncbi:ABC transporter permease [Geosporobacter ferrireducens]|uniref:Cell division protein FtsX n=1 Tax=Geosporobacter ferrireducens TaxID=1424294 RepID=A0A1D8GGF7_9FIRM|nr:ABC transporter permease [Geosporobacter ferrireducens]AOT69995.1 cell division protein FtsX [Geosporobacter ferrireducens]MTI53462.1 FtsX-like permease family protein [Geosporobacter ferrireducens]